MMSNAAQRASTEAPAPSREVGVAHDFKNLLFVITAHCQRLIQTLEPEDIRRRDAEAIAVAADRAVSLTRQILEAGRAAVPSARPIDLNLLLSDLQDLITGVVGEQSTVAWSLTESLWTVRVSQTHLEQIVINLVANARDAMPRGGEVTIGTENRVTDEDGRVREWVVLTVRDTGSGMSSEVQARIFDPYFTTKGTEGTGVGLATVKAIVAASGGRIHVESAPGRGTTVAIWLPRDGATVVMPAPAPREEARGVRSLRPRVLLVDDEPTVRELLAHCLELEGYEAVAAASGQEALAELSRDAAGLDAVVSDLNLPDLSGMTVLAECRRRNPALGAVLISGSSDAALTGRSAGVPVLTKPFSLADFKRAVRGAVSARRV
jgi:two-component system cell cycle sensor histidine kinase/response regulator CckA